MVNETRRIFRGTDEAEAARRVYEASLSSPPRPDRVEAGWLRELCLRAGAADVGFVDVGRAGLGGENDNARRLMPTVRSLICLVGISNRDAIRSTSRATANKAWHRTGDKLESAAARICEELAEAGVRAIPTNMGFPMDVQVPPGQASWAIAHKIVAVEAGMGHMGINRNIIHPKFGNFVLLDTILIDAEIDAYGQPLDYNPCLGCNLCVAACPVGAISNVGDFDFFACLGHNYREFPISATDWVDAVAAGDASAYRAKFREDETLSMLQSLAFEPNYKSAYCMAVCPAGEDVIGPYLADKARHRDDVLLPLRQHPEPVYVQSGSHAEKTAARNPAKRVRYLDFKPDVSTVANFALGLRHMFTPSASLPDGLRVEFRFPDGTLLATVRDQRLTTGSADDLPVDATVVCDELDYIRILHRPIAGRPTYTEPDRYTVKGDPAAFQRLLASLT
ncbi:MULTISPECIES: 4Fe-4S binding protein [Pseudofrankia]|uniref:4Fe-4S binding protein n=1 Tax=Pseudofrankia TaxID=2994363 RepID=UPI000234DAFE|nr:MULTISPECIES: 4Fe-4S binding protein [Pseudofrankia]OHV28838.1 4Fe-4S ferredoxin [Pseudofrankia sp. EUN1h]